MTLRIVRVIGVVMAIVLLGAAAFVILHPLPPVAEGTCGPGRGSESPIEAFVEPGSIGAGKEPSSASGQRPTWQAFVDACQTATDTRMLVAGGLVIGAAAMAIGLPWVVRRVQSDGEEDVAQAAAGWYPDPWNPAAVRWWDGWSWGVSRALPATSVVDEDASTHSASDASL
jgi:Protein of unknown function (DUF2510)